MCRISIPGTDVRFCVGLFALYTVMGSSLPQAAAQTPNIWQGPTSDFEAGTNWDLGIPPANDLTTHLATFNAMESWQNPALTAARELYGLSFTEGGWTLSGPYMLTVGAGGVSCSASSGVIAVNATIGGTGGAAKSGASTLTLSGANTYTGNTVLNAGVLRAEGSNPGTLGAGASQLILNGGTFESYADTANTINYGRNVVVNGNTTITVGRLTPGNDRTAAPRQFGSLSIGNATLAAKLDLTTYTGTEVDASLTFFGTTLTGNANFNLTDLWKPSAWSSFATLNLGNLTDGGNGYGFTATGSWYYSTLVANGGVNVSGDVRLNGTTLHAVGDWSAQYFGGNINLAGGVLQLSGELTRPLGDGNGQIRLTSGSAGFSTYGGGSNVTVNLTDPSTGQSASLVWGSANFNPSTLMLALGSAASSGQLELVNAIDLNGSTRTFNLYRGVGKISGVLSNSESSPAGLIKHTNGGGTLWLANDGNTFDGPIQVLNATLRFESVGNVGGGPSSLGAPTTAADGLISLGSQARSATLRYTGGNDSSTDRMIALPGTTGPIAITADGTGTIRFTNTGQMPTPGAGVKTLTFNGTNAGDNLFAIGIIDNSFTNTTSVAKSGAGTWILSGTNTYTGTTTVSGGTMIATKPAALPGYDSTGKVSATASGATLAVRAGAAGEWTSPEITTLLANATFAAGSNLGVDVTTGNAFEHATAISGSQGLAKLGAGTLTLTGNSIYTGATTISEGILQLGNGGTSGSLSPSSAINNQAVLAFNRSDTLTQGIHFANTIGGSGEVRKLGSGTVILGGNNTCSGPTTVSVGTMLVHGTHTGGGDYTVHSGATLGGTGSIGANIGIHSGGRLAPGASIGRLTIGGDLTLADGAEWDWEFLNNDSPDNYDQVAGPTLILPSDGASTIALNILGMPGHSVNWYDEFVLFTGSVENFDAGMFDVVNNSSWTRGWAISGGNSLVLTAVPEPGTCLILVCSLAFGLLARRRPFSRSFS
ncbi:MAG: autotransporter-associated beta strand repeat-containing protein [Patescibacteria group bacterium]|nr:autotransporter-associated beta strand repeat-containing protein [Patescibacteria group bacterium]